MNLSDRLASLREGKKQTPLSTFLTIYSKAPRDCYINYMRGARALHKWLTSNGEQELDYQETLYPNINKNYKYIPAILDSYDLSEVAKIVSGYRENRDLNRLVKAKKAILVTMIEKVLKELC